MIIDAYVRSETLLSSQIEGTQSSLPDLLLFEPKEPPGLHSTTWWKSPVASAAFLAGASGLRCDLQSAPGGVTSAVLRAGAGVVSGGRLWLTPAGCGGAAARGPVCS